MKDSMPKEEDSLGGIGVSGYPRALSDKRATTEWLKLTKALGRQLAVLAQLSAAKLYEDDGGSGGGDEENQKQRGDDGVDGVAVDKDDDCRGASNEN